MKKGIINLLLALLFISPGCKQEKSIEQNRYNIIPLPNQLIEQEGRFEVNSDVTLNTFGCNDAVKAMVDSFAIRLNKTAGLSLKQTNKEQIEKKSIRFVTVAEMGKEAYKLSVKPEQITLTATEPNGFFYGLQTLYQLLPPQVYGYEKAKDTSWSIPCVEIEDAPRFAYRGLMLDVCRNFVPIEYVYQFIDVLAMNKMNTFHWHLTDDQAWRIEIKKYPKLTQVGAKRKETLIGYYFENFPQEFDGKPQEGFFTQEQIKQVVAYAASKYITVIPEIEMPGHAIAALASYPELSCRPDTTYDVTGTWGIFEQVYCPKEETFTFFEGVMDEVLQLFPSAYIHVGGDECPKTAWENCTNCQQLIKNLGLKDDTSPNQMDGKKHSKEEKLQSYVINRMEKYLNSKGRNIIGWDEILEGGLAPNATVMSWRGTTGGMNAAKSGHDAIMTPSPYMYLDYYQESPEVAPTTIGGWVTLKYSYNYNPVPDDADPMLKKHIIGIQGNIWAEYMPTIEKRNYQIYPRAMAVAESGWTLNKNKNFASFCVRMIDEFERLDVMQINACRNLFDVTVDTHVTNDSLKVYLETYYPNAVIRYTTDGTTPTESSQTYGEPFVLKGTSNLRAAAFEGGKMVGRVTKKSLFGNLISGKKYTTSFTPTWWIGDIFGENETHGKDSTTLGLTNGKRGYTQSYLPWVSLTTNKEGIFTFTVQLDQPTDISKVVFGSLNNPAMSILAAGGAAIEVSTNGKSFKEVAKQTFNHTITTNKRMAFTDSLDFTPVEATYVRVKIKNGGMIKNGTDCQYNDKRAATYPAELYLDEIEVY